MLPIRNEKGARSGILDAEGPGKRSVLVVLRRSKTVLVGVLQYLSKWAKDNAEHMHVQPGGELHGPAGERLWLVSDAVWRKTCKKFNSKGNCGGEVDYFSRPMRVCVVPLLAARNSTAAFYD